MNWHEELQTAVGSAAEAVINSPRLAASVGTATTGLGAAIKMDFITGALSTAAMVAGIIMTLLLARLHWINVQNGQIQNKILLRQLEAMGAEPITEKIP